MKSLKLWQILTLVGVVIAMAGGGYGAYRWANGSNASANAESYQLVSVQYGSLANSVSSSGSLAFPSREKIMFGSPGTVLEVKVKEGDTVKAGQTLATLDSNSLIPLKKAVTQAKINLDAAQDNLDTAMHPYTADDLASAEAAVATAQQQLADAQFKAPLDVADVQYTAWKTETAYWDVYDRYVRGLLDYREVEKAKRDSDRAQYNLDTVKRNATKSISDAQTKLDDARETLAEVKANTPDPLMVELRTEERDAAQAALEDAQQRLAKTTMTAPFNGTVTSLAVEAGQTVTAATAAMEIVDSSVIELSAILDEVDVPQVQIGQKATVTLSSLSDLELAGEVTAISTTGKTQQGVVTYPVTIRITLPSGVTLREGMSATADIIIAESNNVLVVPDRAVSGSTTNPTVQVVVNGEVQSRSVQLGMSDGTRSEVKSGLQEGEQVVVQTTSSTSSSSSSTRTQTGNTGFAGGFPGEGIQIFTPGR